MKNATPILVLYLNVTDANITESLDSAQSQMEKFREHGWLYLIFPITDGRDSFIESHAVEKLDPIEFNKLQTKILEELNGSKSKNPK